jgi:hypothetical protein
MRQKASDLAKANTSESDMRIDARNLTIEPQDEPQHAVSRRALGPEIDGQARCEQLCPWRSCASCSDEQRS